jgi:hypothetical protein
LGEREKEVRHGDTRYERIKKFLRVYIITTAVRKTGHYARPRAH